MNILAIDTSTDWATVALAFNGKRWSQEEQGIRQHAQVLLPLIDQLMTKAGCSLAQLDAIAFGRGPGSFTGLRIACSVAKALAYAHDFPLYPVSGLAAMAWEIRQKEEGSIDLPILAVLDARMQEFYWGVFAPGAVSANEHVTPLECIKVEGPTVLVGFGFESYLPQGSEALQQNRVHTYERYPQANAMIELVQAGHVEPVSARDALPTYIRNQVTHGETHG